MKEAARAGADALKFTHFGGLRDKNLEYLQPIAAACEEYGIVFMPEVVPQDENRNTLYDQVVHAARLGQEAGGDSRGKQSAAILIVKEKGAYDGGTDRYVDIRVDDHEHPIKELRRVFNLYDLSILNRDDPEDKVKIEGKVLKTIKEVLKLDGFYERDVDDKFDEYTKDVLQKWMHNNNFEVKEREDEYMWGSVYRYIEKRKEEL